jgi:hypothetical protein
MPPDVFLHELVQLRRGRARQDSRRYQLEETPYYDPRPSDRIDLGRCLQRDREANTRLIAASTSAEG